MRKLAPLSVCTKPTPNDPLPATISGRGETQIVFFFFLAVFSTDLTFSYLCRRLSMRWAPPPPLLCLFLYCDRSPVCATLICVRVIQLEMTAEDLQPGGNAFLKFTDTAPKEHSVTAAGREAIRPFGKVSTPSRFCACKHSHPHAPGPFMGNLSTPLCHPVAAHHSRKVCLVVICCLLASGTSAVAARQWTSQGDVSKRRHLRREL